MINENFKRATGANTWSRNPEPTGSILLSMASGHRLRTNGLHFNIPPSCLVSVFVRVCVLSYPHQSVLLNCICLCAFVSVSSSCIFIPFSQCASFFLLSPSINSPCATTLCSPLFWSSLMVFHQNLFQSVGSNSDYDCVWLYCFGRDTSPASDPRCVSLLSSSGAVRPKPFFFFSCSLASSINLSLSHQVRGAHTPTSSTDCSYLPLV